MGVLSQLSGIREVKRAVAGDLEGALVEVVGEAEGETIAAVAAFALSQMNAAGEVLGLGAARRITFAGKGALLIVSLVDRTTVAAYAEPSTPAAGLEKKLDAVLHQG